VEISHLWFGSIRTSSVAESTLTNTDTPFSFQSTSLCVLMPDRSDRFLRFPASFPECHVQSYWFS